MKDNSGIRLYVTKKYRPVEFGVLTVIILFIYAMKLNTFYFFFSYKVGAYVDPMSPYHSIVLPPDSNKMSLDYFCKKDCANVTLTLKYYYI